MNILHIISGDGGGISTFIINLIKHKKKEYNYTIISFGKFSPSFIDIAEKFDTKLIEMPRPKEVGIFEFIRFLIIFFQSYKFDFIDCHIPGIYSIIFKYISTIHNSKIFSIHSHQTKLVYGRKMSLVEKIINYLNPIVNNIVASRKIACGTDAAIYGFNNSDTNYIDIIHNSVETEKYYQIYNKKNKSNKIIIGHIGRHSSAKNLEFIIGLGNYIKHNSLQNQFEIHLIGDGEQTKWLNEEIIFRELKDIVYLHGRRDDIEIALASFDILILPSYSEGLPTVLIEAQASGTPSIVSNTITTEVDLDLGLITYLSIEKNITTYEEWIKELLRLKNPSIPPLNEIKNKIIKHKFTPKLMTETFEKILAESIR